jgi:hypothetical protein
MATVEYTNGATAATSERPVLAGALARAGAPTETYSPRPGPAAAPADNESPAFGIYQLTAAAPLNFVLEARP